MQHLEHNGARPLIKACTVPPETLWGNLMVEAIVRRSVISKLYALLLLYRGMQELHKLCLGSGRMWTRVHGPHVKSSTVLRLQLLFRLFSTSYVSFRFHYYCQYAHRSGRNP